MIIGGLDVGTTGCKLTAYDEKGNFVYNSYREYEVSRLGGEHEIDAASIYSAVCDVISDTAGKYELYALGVTTFGEAFVALDEDDSILLPTMLYTDPRGSEECDRLCSKLGEKALIEISGVKPHQMYSLPKVMWIKNNLGDIFSRVKRILLMEDFIIYMLTGNAVIDYSLAARTMAFDIRSKCWSREIFDAAGIDADLFSTPVAPFNIAGEIRAEVCKKLGLTKTIKIVNGAHDQVAAAVGSGVLEVGKAVDGTGTVECVTPVFDKIPENEELYTEGYSVVPFVFENTYVCYALSYTGGAAIKWFRDNLSSEKSYAALDASVSDNPTGILIMPHFAGAANPYMDNGSKAAFLGVTLETTGADFYKALMEGVTYEMMTNIRHLESFGIKPEKLYATGGGASSKVWLQIKADILNLPVVSLNAKEAGACGTCMMVGVATGLFSDLFEAKKYFVQENETFMPNKDRVAVYGKYYNAYRKIYDAVRPIIKELEEV